MDDDLDSIPYVCMVTNLIIRSVVQGADALVEPQSSPEGSTFNMESAILTNQSELSSGVSQSECLIAY